MTANIGLIQVYTGGGKGKTSAALGVALRALGHGLKVGIVFFDKGGTHYSERPILEWLAAGALPTGGKISFEATGLDRIDPETGRFRFGVTEDDRKEARRGLEAAGKMLSGERDLVILDEFNTSLSIGLIAEKEGQALVDGKAKTAECICTGRDAPAWLVDRADLVTQMDEIKHYFKRGIKAREGIDY